LPLFCHFEFMDRLHHKQSRFKKAKLFPHPSTCTNDNTSGSSPCLRGLRLYLVPNNHGTGHRLVRRSHPPPTTAPHPDDFDAITGTRDSTTVYDDAANSALDTDYDDITVPPIFKLLWSDIVPIVRSTDYQHEAGGEYNRRDGL